jgi:CBS domain-containing protein
VETATINYRVADFLKKYPPFHSMAEEDLLTFAARGRVRFHEPNDYLLWQGEPHRSQVFVIQQGTVSLWNESAAMAELRDVRGAGDMLGLERFNGAEACLFSARSESDVVIYAFPAEDFAGLLSAYPHARDYVNAEGRVTVDYQPTGDRRDKTGLFLHQLVAHKTVPACDVRDAIGDTARRMLALGTDALAVVDADHRVRGVLTASTFLEWAASGAATGHDGTVGSLLTVAPVIVGPTASVADGVLAMSSIGAPAIAMTEDGTAAGRLHAVVTTRDLGAVFGEQPATLLHEIRTAAGAAALRDLNHRLRAFALQHLTNAGSVDWLARFTHLADASMVKRLLALAGADTIPACWCFSGSSGRAESLTRLAPQMTLIVPDSAHLDAARDGFERVRASLDACDYLPRLNLPFAPPFYVATIDEWTDRYEGWVGDPVRQEMYRARTLFDLRAVEGDRSLWQRIDATVRNRVDTNFLHILANDCLATLPPLTFFEDAVVDKSGEQTDVFHLEETALRPLVDVGRVFGLAGRTALGHSTVERFATARALLPERQAMFREAADTLLVVLWQQGRIGIAQGTSGIDLPPALLSRHDRHVLKSGFRSILQLLQFTADLSWIETL